MFERWLTSLCAVAALAGCASGDPAAYVEELLAADANFAREAGARGVADAFDAYLTDDAIHLAPPGQPVEGRAAIVDNLRALDDGWALDWEPAHAEASVDGSLGWTWGRYALYRIETPQARQTGKYLTVWRRDRDGRWRVSADIGNPDPPVPD